ncbi:MAG: rRNA maturation RNase YbeY [Actinomycetota bacterium]|nr:rRNA maturation RNase YbeY [Actinomycetota bacterium]
MTEPPESSYSIVVADEQSIVVDADALSKLTSHALHALDIPPGAELSIVLAHPERMATLKGAYLGEAVPTDVLAFPMDASAPGEGPHLLGDVVLCPAVAEEQAASVGHSTAEELHLLLVHGILHLLGHDHAEPDEQIVMQSEERRILGSFAGVGG